MFCEKQNIIKDKLLTPSEKQLNEWFSHTANPGINPGVNNIKKNL